MTSDQWTSIIEHALWPIVVLVLGVILREPIGAFLRAVSGRVTKLSVMSVSVELAVVRATDPPWRGVGGDDVRGLVVAQQVNDSYFSTLREALGASGLAEYFMVDFRSDGDEWLTSRLYLFGYLLARLKAVKAVVFVATRGDVASSFLAVGRVDAILRTLAGAQPWLCAARLEAEANQIGRLPNPPAPPMGPVPAGAEPLVPADVDEWWAGVREGSIYVDPLKVAQQFLERVQWEQPPGAADPADGWLQLPDEASHRPTWEHATWLRSADLTDGLLRNAIQAEGWVVDNPSWTADERVRAVAAEPGDFIALVTASRRFDRLVDRRSLLMTLGERSAKHSAVS